MSDLASVMDALVALEATVEAPGTLRGYRWRPTKIPELPCIYHWMMPSPASYPATNEIVDQLNLAIRVGLRNTDTDEQMVAVEHYFGRLRDVIDVDLMGPVGSSTLRAPGLLYDPRRSSTRTVLDTFNDIDVMCLEFSLTGELRRIVGT